MTRLDDDDFAVWPFRRQLVDEYVHPPALRQPPLPIPAARTRRRGPSPLRLAVPLAVLAFFASLAGAAMVGDPANVQRTIQKQITPVAKAAPDPVGRAGAGHAAARAAGAGR